MQSDVTSTVVVLAGLLHSVSQYRCQVRLARDGSISKSSGCQAENCEGPLCVMFRRSTSAVGNRMSVIDRGRAEADVRVGAKSARN